MSHNIILFSLFVQFTSQTCELNSVKRVLKMVDMTTSWKGCMSIFSLIVSHSATVVSMELYLGIYVNTHCVAKLSREELITINDEFGTIISVDGLQSSRTSNRNNAAIPSQYKTRTSNFKTATFPSQYKTRTSNFKTVAIPSQYKDRGYSLPIQRPRLFPPNRKDRGYSLPIQKTAAIPSQYKDRGYSLPIQKTAAIPSQYKRPRLFPPNTKTAAIPSEYNARTNRAGFRL